MVELPQDLKQERQGLIDAETLLANRVNAFFTGKQVRLLQNTQLNFSPVMYKDPVPAGTILTVRSARVLRHIDPGYDFFVEGHHDPLSPYACELVEGNQ